MALKRFSASSGSRPVSGSTFGFLVAHVLVAVEDHLDGAGVAGEGGHGLAQTFLDATGDLDFALAGQQLDGAHLAHASICSGSTMPSGR